MRRERPAILTAPAPARRPTDCELFWEVHVPRLLETGRDTTVTGLDATACFDITGTLGGRWVVRARDGVIESVERGDAPDATVVVTLAAEDFLAVALGSEDHRELFFQERIRVEGDVATLLRVANLIPHLRELHPFRPDELRT